MGMALCNVHGLGLLLRTKIEIVVRWSHHIAGSNQICSKLNVFAKHQVGDSIAFCFTLAKNDVWPIRMIFCGKWKGFKVYGHWRSGRIKHSNTQRAVRYVSQANRKKKNDVSIFGAINAKFTILLNLILISASFSFVSTHWVPIQLFQLSRTVGFCKCTQSARVSNNSFLLVVFCTARNGHALLSMAESKKAFKSYIISARFPVEFKVHP